MPSAKTEGIFVNLHHDLNRHTHTFILRKGSGITGCAHG
jgi:hypothetical protein